MAIVSGSGWWISVIGGLDSGGMEVRSAQDEMVRDGAKGAFYRLTWQAEESGARRSPASVDFNFDRWFREEEK
jgi:hypothetical protein